MGCQRMDNFSVFSRVLCINYSLAISDTYTYSINTRIFSSNQPHVDARFMLLMTQTVSHHIYILIRPFSIECVRACLHLHAHTHKPKKFHGQNCGDKCMWQLNEFNS